MMTMIRQVRRRHSSAASRQTARTTQLRRQPSRSRFAETLVASSRGRRPAAGSKLNRQSPAAARSFRSPSRATCGWRANLLSTTNSITSGLDSQVAARRTPATTVSGGFRILLFAEGSKTLHASPFLTSTPSTNLLCLFTPPLSLRSLPSPSLFLLPVPSFPFHTSCLLPFFNT